MLEAIQEVHTAGNSHDADVAIDDVEVEKGNVIAMLDGKFQYILTIRLRVRSSVYWKKQIWMHSDG